jgi:methionyl-tRNA formyltransferase
LVFFGTPEFALTALRRLCEAGRAPSLVVSQPARPVGRGHKLQDPPVAAWARDAGLPVLQPEKANTRAVRRAIEAERPDVAAVIAYGEILTRQLLAVPPHGFVNVHASLLPRHRGAAPIQAAIAAGEAVTGVTTMRVEPGLDSGPILLQREIPIGRHETAAELSPRLAEAGAELLLDTLHAMEAGTLAPRPQAESEATYAPRLSRADGRADWSWTAQELYDRLRAYTPWPGLTAELAGDEIKLLRLRVADAATAQPPGRVLGVDGDGVIVSCGGATAVRLERVQRPGRGAVTGAEWARSAIG